MTSASLLRQLARPRAYICQKCLQKRQISTRKQQWAGGEAEQKATQWRAQVERIRSGEQLSMLSILEQRGFVKDVAGYVCSPKALQLLMNVAGEIHSTGC